MRARVSRAKPDRLDIAGWFAKDAADYVARFRCCYYSNDYDFQSIKSRRMKMFVDLRGAIEAILKAFIALRQPYMLGGELLVKRIEKFGHRLDVLFLETRKLWHLNDTAQISKLLEDCDSLPIGLRYTLDAMAFMQADEDLYYRTIGSDAWVSQLETVVAESRRRLQEILDRQSRVVTGSDLSLRDLLDGPFNKFTRRMTERGRD